MKTDRTSPKAIAVFCGSSLGASPIYADAAIALGNELARNEIELIYGGGHVGLMGVVADAVLSNNGSVTGVMPKSLVEQEIAHKGLTHLKVVDSMHERKSKMAELADGFIAMPGGAGTLEEITEQWTWAQLGIHQKPCAFLDIDGFFQPLKAFIENLTDAQFMKPEYRDMLIFSDNPGEILSRFQSYSPPLRKWVGDVEA